jgi:hypothetical protein
MSKIKILEISKLLECNFFIPSYQRGYRWTEQQVTDLLDDVWEFINNPQKSDWYCLQPVVVKETNSETKNEFNLSGIWYDVIDGQQRLTTIYLILKNLERFVESERNNFEIQYETRKDSKHFLNELVSKTKADSEKNVDYFHIYNAYSTIKTWFQNKANEGHSSISSKFITPFIEKVKVIWFETSNNDDSIDIFTRINSGKIPLTNSELVKALFLNSSNFVNIDEVKLGLIQREIASEWDRIEYALQDDSFWYFINKGENNLATRIEFILNLIADKKEKDEDLYTFRFFSEKFNTISESEINDKWKEIKKHFQTLEEWYNDRELYHKIGYLITIGTDIKTIIEDKNGNSRKKFEELLDNKIANVVNKKSIDDLEYGNDNTQIINILLLHNILTVLKSADDSSKFPFDKYKDKKKEGWSIEHIHAQNSEIISEIADFEEWNNSIDENLLTEDIKKRLLEFKKDKKKEVVESLVIEISNLFGDIEVHSIDNLALLTKNDNSKLNNGLFPVKRERIIKLEKEGAFVPLASKKVFQKYFEGCTKQISKWEEKDRIAYLNDIKNTLNHYINHK